MYLHTDGRREITMDFNERPTDRPWLVSSSGEVTFATISKDRIEGDVSDLQDSELVFGGFLPEASINIRISDRSSTTDKTATIDKGGEIRIKVTPACHFVLSPPGR